MRLLFQQEAFGSRDGAVQEMHGGEPEESQSSIPEDGENVSERKYVVPDGMLEAAVDAAVKFSGANTIQASPRVKAEIEESFRVAIEAAIRWLSENPIVPTDKQYYALCEAQPNNVLRVVEWTRRMFLAPEPEAPKDVFRFHAILRRPATVRDDPSEREKKLGIRETVLCVRASDYDNLLNLIQNRKKTSS